MARNFGGVIRGENDTSIEDLNWLRKEIENCWKWVERYKEEDEETNQLLIHLQMERIDRMTRILNIAIYN